MIKNLGFMQGRLVNSEKKNAIQYFPEKNWPKELKIAKKINFKYDKCFITLLNSYLITHKNPV